MYRAFAQQCSTVPSTRNIHQSFTNLLDVPGAVRLQYIHTYRRRSASGSRMKATLRDVESGQPWTRCSATFVPGRDSFELVGHAAYGEISRKAGWSVRGGLVASLF